MCGIFGHIKTENPIARDQLILKNLVLLSESRGKESSGIAYRSSQELGVFKTPKRGKMLLTDNQYKQIVRKKLITAPYAVIGHTRLVTNGAMENNRNNQPVVKNGLVGIHNGIIVNDSQLWKAHKTLEKTTEVDTEVLLALIKNFETAGQTLVSAAANAFQLIEGTASVALLFDHLPYLLLATNNGSLYFFEARHSLIFASEEYILRSLIELLKIYETTKITRVEPGEGYLVDIRTLQKTKFPLFHSSTSNELNGVSVIRLPIQDFSEPADPDHANPPSLVTEVILPPAFTKLDTKPIASLNRCANCILPKTMPFIKFDKTGVCNYCSNYQKVRLRSEADLLSTILQSKKRNAKFDCVVPLSGGRDSSFALHYAKKVLGLNPIAYSYDWGMLTDLGRRNQARMCGKLGVEHILISADIRKKRDNIRKNVVAWLKKPHLGTIPLFMAGDKQYFHFANWLSQVVGGAPILYAENPYEKTDFKSGFCGVPPAFDIEHVYNLGFKKKIKLAGFYFKEFLKNPAFLNSSILDTVQAYISSYFLPHNYIYLYLYKKWDEQEIVSILKHEYNWEVAEDTPTTWRIGDGTAAFYNFIYLSVAGLTEADTFRSNQIREGAITRSQALKLASAENTPRYESIKWYCDIIGLDFNDILNRILNIPKLY